MAASVDRGFWTLQQGPPVPVQKPKENSLPNQTYLTFYVRSLAACHTEHIVRRWEWFNGQKGHQFPQAATLSWGIVALFPVAYAVRAIIQICRGFAENGRAV